MSNYFRITAYHPEQDLSAIFDSNGYFEKLWQFSAYLIQKGFKIIEVGNEEFKIIEVGNEEKFDEGDMPKAERTPSTSSFVPVKADNPTYMAIPLW